MRRPLAQARLRLIAGPRNQLAGLTWESRLAELLDRLGLQRKVGMLALDTSRAVSRPADSNAPTDGPRITRPDATPIRRTPRRRRPRESTSVPVCSRAGGELSTGVKPLLAPASVPLSPSATAARAGWTPSAMAQAPRLAGSAGNDGGPKRRTGRNSRPSWWVRWGPRRCRQSAARRSATRRRSPVPSEQAARYQATGSRVRGLGDPTTTAHWSDSMPTTKSWSRTVDPGGASLPAPCDARANRTTHALANMADSWHIRCRSGRLGCARARR